MLAGARPGVKDWEEEKEEEGKREDDEDSNCEKEHDGGVAGAEASPFGVRPLHREEEKEESKTEEDQKEKKENEERGEEWGGGKWDEARTRGQRKKR